MRTIPVILALGLAFVVQAGPAAAVVLLDTGLNTSTAALHADTSEHFSCDGSRCEQDYDVVMEQASMITLAQGGLASAFTFAASDPNGPAFISLFRASASGKMISDSAHLLWTGSTQDFTSSTGLGSYAGYPLRKLTFSGLSIALQAGSYWVEYQTGPTFKTSDVLMAGDGFSRLAQRAINTTSDYVPTAGGPHGWGYYPDPRPQVSIRIDASSVFPASVPEPAIWMMLMGGFGLAGAMLRRRRPAPAAG